MPRGLFIVVDGIGTYQLNATQWEMLSFSDDNLQKLKKQSQFVLSGDPRQAMLVTLMFPKQAATPLGQTNVYFDKAEETFEMYLCIRDLIDKVPERAEKFKSIIEYMDDLYV
ncbi:MAG: hypothetical protein KDD62_09440, partial [Bdellovibrionales bacterium]|nr:hypothetical protein [Bdellovibrionales bacterium]